MQTAAEYLDDRRLAGDPDAQPLPPIVIAAAAAGHDPDAPAPRAEAERAIEDAFEPLELEDDDVSALHASIDALVASSQSASSRDCWEVQITRTCFRSWRYLDRSLRRPVLRILRQLVTGREARGAVNHAKPLAHAEPGLALFESYLPRGWRLLWEETFAYSERYGCWRDMILLWDVCAHDGVEGRVRAISERFRRRRAAAAACTPPPPRPPERAPTAGGVRRPREAAEAARPAASEAAAAGEYTLELSALAAVEPQPAEAEAGPSRHRTHFEGDATAMAEVRRRAAALARAALAGRENRLEGEEACIAAAELDVICAEGPVLVVGRSGTGKTSCAVVRLWSLYHAYWSLGRGAALLPSGHLRTVFLTTNPMLLATVRRLVSDFESGHSLSAAGRATALDRDGDALPPLGRADAELPDALRSLPDDSYPLFVTGRKWLDLIDGTLVRPFFLRGADGAITERPGRLLEYDRFEEEVWQALAQGRSGVPHPMLVWTEFLSNIQGSVESLASAEDHLGLEQYLTLGRNRSRIDEAQRRIIHGLYGRYRSLKRQRGFYDVTDVVHHIYREVCAHGYSGPPIHEVIVDEVQDFTQAELALLIVVCGDPGGLFFCGDTCQTIARGVSFRFCDLRSLFHFEACVAGASRRALIACNQLPVRQLTKNYRSHGGILAASAVVVDMLELLFDREIDVLQRDTGPSPHRFCAALMRSGTGISAGPPPSLLLADDVQSLVLFLFGKERGQGRHLGADQVVVVRGEGARARLLGPLGRSNVLTVEEVKGLEFSDVLLFNFFADSPKGDERAWREAARAAESGVKVRAGAAAAAAGAQPEAAPMDFTGLQADGEAIEQARGRKRAAEEFDPYKHRLIATELKQLYTAMTRAKRAVWVYDESTKLRKPMFDLLASAGVAVLVDPNAEPTSPGGGRWAAGESRIQESSPEEWEKRGKEFMDRKLFEAAGRAFENAGNKRLATLALAQLEMQRAAKIGNPKKRKSQFLLAGKLFEEIGELNRAADAYELGGNAEKAKALRAPPVSKKPAAAKKQEAAAKKKAEARATLTDYATLDAEVDLDVQTRLARLEALILQNEGDDISSLQARAARWKAIRAQLGRALERAHSHGVEMPSGIAKLHADTFMEAASTYEQLGRPEAEQWANDAVSKWDKVEERYGVLLGSRALKGAEAYFVLARILHKEPRKAEQARAAGRKMVALGPTAIKYEAFLETLLGEGYQGLHRLAVDDTQQALSRAKEARERFLSWSDPHAHADVVELSVATAAAGAYIAEVRLLAMSLEKHAELESPGEKALSLEACRRLQPAMELDASALCHRLGRFEEAACWARLACLHAKDVDRDPESLVARAYGAQAQACEGRRLYGQALLAAKLFARLAIDPMIMSEDANMLVQRLERLAAAEPPSKSPPPTELGIRQLRVMTLSAEQMLKRVHAVEMLESSACTDAKLKPHLLALISDKGRAIGLMRTFAAYAEDLRRTLSKGRPWPPEYGIVLDEAHIIASVASRTASELGRRCGYFEEAASVAEESIDFVQISVRSDGETARRMRKMCAQDWKTYALVLQKLEEQGKIRKLTALEAAREAHRLTSNDDPDSDEIGRLMARLLRARESALTPLFKAYGAPKISNLHLLGEMLREQLRREPEMLSRFLSGQLQPHELCDTFAHIVQGNVDVDVSKLDMSELADSTLTVAMLSLAVNRSADEVVEWSHLAIERLEGEWSAETYELSPAAGHGLSQRRVAAWVCLSEALEAQGRLMGAVVSAAKAVQLDPDNVVAQLCLQRVLAKTGDAAPAELVAQPASQRQSGFVLDIKKVILPPTKDQIDIDADPELARRTNDARKFSMNLCRRMYSGAWLYAEAAEKCGVPLQALSARIKEVEAAGGKVADTAYFAEAELSLYGAIAHTAAGDAEAGKRWAQQAVEQWAKLDARFPGEDLRRKPAAAGLALAEAFEMQGRRAEALQAARAAAACDPMSTIVDDFIGRLEGRTSTLPTIKDNEERAAALQAAINRAIKWLRRFPLVDRNDLPIESKLVDACAAEARALYLAYARNAIPGSPVSRDCLVKVGYLARQAAQGALAAGRWKDAERFLYPRMLLEVTAHQLKEMPEDARRVRCEECVLLARSFESRGMLAYALRAARDAAQADGSSAEAAAVLQRLYESQLESNAA